jgi:hypothetical protein
MVVKVKNRVTNLKPKSSSRLESLVSKINKHNIHKEIKTGQVVDTKEW